MISNCGAFLGAVLLILSAAAAAEGASLTGRVRLAGPMPEPEFVQARSKGGEPIPGCGHEEKLSPRLRVSPEGGVRDAVVCWETPVPFEGGRAHEAVLDQVGCVFEPHVLLVPEGGTLVVLNSDPVLHNVRVFDGIEMKMHDWQKPDGAPIRWRAEKPGRYVVRCGVHLWMYAWAVVTPHAGYAVTDARGRFTLPALPPGRHTLKVWHETLGEREVAVEIGEGIRELPEVLYE